MKISAAQALLKELERWGIDHIYGIPGSSLNGMMDALEKEKDKISYIQVRQEGAGAMAAAADYKFSHKIGVAFGSGGPGASNMINGLYDAKLDRVPMLALVAQGDSSLQNTSGFQETEVLPLYENVGIYNRKAMNAKSIPYMVEDAIRAAYEFKGPAVIILHNDFMEEKIEYKPLRTPLNEFQSPHYPIKDEQIDEVVDYLLKAKNPVLYLGEGVRGYRDLAVAVSEKFNLPTLSSALSTGNSFPNEHKNYLGAFGRLGTKPAFEIMQNTDLVLYVGSNFPFARYWNKSIKFIQVNNSYRDLGRQMPSDLSILADSGDFLNALLDRKETRKESKFLLAARENMKNWRDWLRDIADSEAPYLLGETVMLAIKDKLAKDDSLFALDVGNNKAHAIRNLPFYENQRMIMSGRFATLGYGLPGGIAGKISYPDREVFTIQGDGGYAMNMQEIVTQAKYNLPIINILLTDLSFGFIEHSQKENLEYPFGIKIADADWAKTAEAMGAIAFSVKTKEELDKAIEEVNKLQENGNRKPIFIEAKILYRDPVDTGNMKLDPNKYSKEEIDKFKEEYKIDLPNYEDLIKKY